jgi:hypothetical protein
VQEHLIAPARKEKLQQKFLEVFPQLWTKTSTAKATGRDASTIDEWLREDPEFRRRFEEEAIPAVGDAPESDAIQNILHGIPRPAGFYQGQPVRAPVYNPKTGKPKKDRKGEPVMAPVKIREFPTALHSIVAQGCQSAPGHVD